MPQHGRHPVAAADPPVQRFGGISVETALVLALMILIAGGSLLVHALVPSKRETEAVVGDKKVRVTTVGKGGVLPGALQPRVIPVVVPTAVATIPAVKPIKSKKPKPTATAIPTATTKPGGGGGGTGTGGGGSCTILILCKPGETPEPTSDPGDIETGGVEASPGPGTTATPAPKKNPTSPPLAPVLLP